MPLFQPDIQTISGGTTGAVGPTVSFANSNGVSFGVSGNTVTAVVGSVTAGGVDIAAGTGTAASTASGGTVIFSNSNGVSFGLSAGTMTASVNAAGSITVSAGSVSTGLNSVVFSNSNNVSFGLNGSTVTASATVASTAASISVSAGTSSAALNSVVFSNASGMQFGLNGSTITAQPQPVSFHDFKHRPVASYGVGFGSVHLQREYMPAAMTATRLDFIGNLSVSGSTAGSVTFQVAAYTFSGSTASVVSSDSIAYTWNSGTTATSNQYGGFSGTRWRSIALNSWALTPGDYMIALNATIAGVAGTTGSMSFWGESSISFVGDTGAGGNYSYYFADGVYGSVSATVPSSFQLSDVNQTGRTPQPFLRFVGTGP